MDLDALERFIGGVGVPVALLLGFGWWVAPLLRRYFDESISTMGVMRDTQHKMASLLEQAHAKLDKLLDRHR